MALTQSAWTVKSVKDQTVAQCTVTATTAENDAYTLATPSAIDCKKPYSLTVCFSAAPDSAVVVPIAIWLGFREDFALSGDSTAVAPVIANSGAKFKNVIDDAITAITPVSATVSVDPFLPQADVIAIASIASGLKSRVPAAPCHVIHLDGASTLLAHTATYTIVQ